MESRNEHQFEYILNDLNVNPDLKLKCFEFSSTFEKVLKTPNSRKFIELCIHNGSDFYKVSKVKKIYWKFQFNCSLKQRNVDGIYPLRFAVESFTADNLITIMKSVGEKVGNNCDDVQFSMIVNETVEGNNYLHFLITHLDEKNKAEVTEMIKLLLVNGCNPNLPNNLSETPVNLLLKKLRHINIANDLIQLFVDHTTEEFRSHSSSDIINIMEERGLRHRTSTRKHSTNDVHFMIQQLEKRNETGFLKSFESFKASSRNFQSETAMLLEEAIVRNMSKSVDFLMNHGTDVNEMANSGKYKKSPAHLACSFGHHQVLKLLLNSDKLKFKCANARSNLLHQIFSSRNVEASDRQKCFDLIIADRRCTLSIINGSDGLNRSPLYLSCQHGLDEISKELLRRGAFIGHESVINNIDKNVLKEFLDESIRCSSGLSDKSCEITIDYRFLMPPNVNDKSHLEMESLHLIANNKKLKDLILHPVFSSFLLFKWRKIDFLVYFNLFVYFCFMLFLGVFITNFFRGSVYVKVDDGSIFSGNGGAFGAPASNSGGFQESPVAFDYNDLEVPDVQDRSKNPFLNINNSPSSVNQENVNIVVYRTTTNRPATTYRPTRPPPPLTPDLDFKNFDNSDEEDKVDDSGRFKKILKKVPDVSPKTDKYPGGKSPSSVTNNTTEVEAKTNPVTTTTQTSDTANLLSLIFGFQSDNRKSRSKRSTDKVVDRKRVNEKFYEHPWSYRFCVFGVALMMIYEIVQCSKSFKTYFFKLSNWLDISLICLSLLVFVGTFEIDEGDFKKIRAITILVMAAQSIQLVAKVSVLSMSLHMAIFKRVCVTFLKTIALYLILILAFAMSFYTLNDDDEMDKGSLKAGGEDEEKSFADPFMSVITTVRMMLSDFENVKLAEKDRFQGSMFLLFVVLITVVLYNLLNALAISDTNNIMKDAERVDTKKRISILSSYEKLFRCCKPSFVNIFPTMATIMITPNRDNTIRIKKSFKSSNSVNVLIHKTAKPQKFEIIYRPSWMFWKKEKSPMKLTNKITEKILIFLENRREQKTFENDNKNLRETLEKTSQELLSLKTSQQAQNQVLENLVKTLCRRENFMKSRNSENYKTVQTEEIFM